MVSSVEGLSIEKDQPSFIDFKFINKTLDLNEENEMVTEVGADKPSKEEKLSIASMGSNNQNKWTDVDEDGFTLWSVETEYRDTDEWSKSQYGMIALEWDPNPYRM